MTEWREQLKRLIDDNPDLSMKGVSVRAGLNPSALHDIIKRNQSPSLSNFIAICHALNVRPSEILDAEGFSTISIPVVGYVNSSETWTPAANEAEASIDFEVGGHDTIALEVKGDSMAPVYRHGDVLICHRRYGPHADNLIGLDCVVRTMRGDHVLKILKRGSRPNRFNLKSYNPVIDDIEDVALAWAAPVSWIRRGAR